MNEAMVFLTGDVHSQSARSRERSLIAPQTEIQLAVKYATIAADYGVRVTLFLSGGIPHESPEAYKQLREMPNVEVGGHGYHNFQPRWVHQAFRLLGRSYWGPRAFQRRDIARCLTALESDGGTPVTSWRNHGFVHDKNTQSLLRDAGVRVWSDRRDGDAAKPNSTLASPATLTINTPVDHEHLIHGRQTTSRRSRHEPMTPDQWLGEIYEVIRSSPDMPATTILAHPVCMFLLDEFSTFTRLCQQLSHFNTLFARDFLDIRDVRKPA